MSDLKFDINVNEVLSHFQDIKKQAKSDITKSVENLASMTHAKVLELASDNLKSLSQKYMENVEFDNPTPNLWIVSLKEPALFIEEGRKSGFMDELLNGKSARYSKKGVKYAIIPFKHSTNPSQQSTKAQRLANEIKQGLRQAGIVWNKIEKNPDGSPRLGRLHTLNIESAKLKPFHKTPATYGVSVYQHQTLNGARRDIMTFRIITEKHRAEGLWFHPGMKGKRFLDQAFEWAMHTWEKEILPAMYAKYRRD